MKTNAKERKLFKYLFVTLVIAIIVGFGFIWVQIHGNVINPSKGYNSKNDDTPISVSLDKNQLNSISSYYLKQFEHKNNNMNYKFWVSDHAYVYGKIKVLGSKVGYILTLNPELLDNGDVELKANGLEVGELNIPPKFVISYVGKHYKVPKWVELDGKSGKIILHVNKLGGKNKLSYRADKIDMSGNGNFKFKVLIPNQ